MVMRLTTLLFILTNCCFGQERKDLVYGGLANQELISAVRFSGKTGAGEFIKIDNMGTGDPFPIVISHERIEYVASIHREDTIRISKTAYNCVYHKLISDTLLFRKNMSTVCGTFRLIFYDGIDVRIYFVDGYPFSRSYFESLPQKIGECKAERITKRIENVVRAFKVGLIPECR